MNIRLLYLAFKNLKFYYYVPLAVLYVMIPVGNLMQIRLLGLAAAWHSVTVTAQRLIPIVSVWWVFCLLKEYLEGDGLELLYVYESRKKTKTKIGDVLLILFWYALHAALLFAVYSIFFDDVWRAYGIIMIQSFVLTAAYYLLAYLCRSTSLSLMLVLAYYFFSAFFSKNCNEMTAQGKLANLINIFSLEEPLSFSLLSAKYLPLLGAGMVLLLLAHLLNRRYHRLFAAN